MKLHLPNLVITMVVVIIGQAACVAQTIKVETIVVPTTIQLPAEASKPTSVLIALKVTNNDSHELVINKYESPLPKLQMASGAKLGTREGLDISFFKHSDEYTDIAPGLSTYIFLEAELERGEDGYRLHGGRADGGWWTIGSIKPGNYSLSLDYFVPKDSLPDQFKAEHAGTEVWFGTISSPPVKVTFQ